MQGIISLILVLDNENIQYVFKLFDLSTKIYAYFKLFIVTNCSILSFEEIGL